MSSTDSQERLAFTISGGLMSLVDLNGNPIRAQDAINPFTMRTVTDFPPLSDDDINMFIQAANDLLRQQVPLSMPAGLPVELLVRVGATLELYAKQTQSAPSNTESEAVSEQKE
jgi:hypothetical protein